jgi:hypothetical protein
VSDYNAVFGSANITVQLCYSVTDRSAQEMLAALDTRLATLAELVGPGDSRK